MADLAAIAINRALLERETPDDEPPPVRIAAYLFFAEGLLSIVLAMAYGGWATRLSDATLSLLIGFGILQRRRVWRFIGALGAGNQCGYYLALIAFSFWPPDTRTWGWLLGDALVCALAGWQLWALTNWRAQYYFRPRFPTYVTEEKFLAAV